MSVNKVQIIGNLGRDPEIRSFSNGGRVCNIRVATTEKWKSKDGERKEHTEWHSVAIFQEGLVGVCEKYLKKGSKVYVEGTLKTRKYQAQDGSDRYSTEIVLQGFGGTLVMLDSKGGGDSGGGSYDSGGGGVTVGSGAGASANIDDDEIPF
jgi:single-strand DNA-binding protein